MIKFFSDKARERLISILAFILGLFHLLSVSGILVLSTMVVRVFHLTLIFGLIFLAPINHDSKYWNLRFIVAVGLCLLAFCTGTYLLIRWETVALSGGVTTWLDIVVGSLILLLVLEATRRSVGKALALIALIFLAYPFISPVLPGLFFGRGVRFENLVSFLSFSGQGIFGIPVGVASTYIILFTIFGAFLREFGAGDFFFKFSSSITQGFRAASAKTAVLFSTLLGMISGSAAGNVAVTGSFTIPLMKREGYQSHQAGAIEAVVSTGGQIMPPVMGAAAFIMAEIVGMPYVSVMKAAVVPALLFFCSLLFVVHLQAIKSGIEPRAKSVEKGVSLSRSLREGAPFFVPFFTLVTLMIMGYSPVKASFYAIVILVVVYLCVTREFSRVFLDKTARAIANGVRAAIPISAACAAAGIISAVLSMTGLGSKLSASIISLSGGVPIIALLLTMLTAIILGMGLPTTAAYLILATVVAPALADLGVPLLTAHMFVFFFGCVSTITPPVALASYVAAGVARADINRVGWTAFRYGSICYLLPFAFFFGPGLLAQGSAWEVAISIGTGIIGVYFLATAIVGYLAAPLSLWTRLLVAVAGILLLSQGLLTDLIGLFVGLSVVFVSRSWRNAQGVP